VKYRRRISDSESVNVSAVVSNTAVQVTNSGPHFGG
jgi:hypothetical protein